MKGFWYGSASLVLAFGLVISACAAPKAAPASPPSPVVPAQQAPTTTPTTPSSEWDKVLAAAMKEGTVTVYSSQGPLFMEALRTGMKQYGLKVEAVGGTGGELEQKIVTEQRAKNLVADVFTGGFTNQLSVLQAGYAQTVDVALPVLADNDVWKVTPTQYDPTKRVYVYGMSITPSLIINTDLVKRGEIQSWQDLLDPRWRDRMVMSDPRIGYGPGTSGVEIFSRALGEEFWKKMAAQRITLHGSYGLAVERVALGEKSLAIFPPYSRLVIAIRAGAPLQVVHMKEGTAYYLTALNIVKTAPHPNASRVLLNWMLGKEGQMAVGKAMGNYSIRKDVIETWLGIPELNPKTFTLIEPAGGIDLASQQAAADFAKRIFGAQ